MANNHDDLENFDDSHFDDLDTDIDTSYDEPLPGDLSADLTDDLVTADAMSDQDIAEDDFGGDENWDDQGTDAQYDEPQPQKKKSSLLTYGIIGLVVIGGAGFALTKLGGSSQPVAPDVATPAAIAENSLGELRDEAAQQAQLETPTPDAPAPPPQSQGFMNEEVPSLPSAPTMTAVDSATPPPVEALPVAAPPPPPAVAEAPADPAVIGGLKPVSDFPSVDKIKKSDATPAPAVPVTPVVSELPVPDLTAPLPVETPVTPVVNQAEIAVLHGKLEAAQSKIDALEKDLSVAKSVPDNSKSDALVNELKEKVTSLETKLASKEEALNEARQARKVQPEPVAAKEKQENAPVIAEEPVVTASVRTDSIKTELTPLAKTVLWDLRGAQPGKAMLSKKGSEDVRTVSVGDTLPGLGRIVSISQGSDGWTVKGTLGRVTQ